MSCGLLRIVLLESAEFKHHVYDKLTTLSQNVTIYLCSSVELSKHYVLCKLQISVSARSAIILQKYKK